MSYVYYVMERLGAEATAEDARRVLGLAKQLAAEQGTEDFDAIDWLNVYSYNWVDLLEAANGDTAALARARADAGLPV